MPTLTRPSLTSRSSSRSLLDISSGSHLNLTICRNKTYRLRLINSGSLVGEEFSIDNHLLTVIEADGTAVEPVVVSSVFPVIAQRYSVLITTNQSAGAYWVRMNLDSSAFTVSSSCQNCCRSVRKDAHVNESIRSHILPLKSLA